MDQFLAEYFGTNQDSAPESEIDDLEKTAQLVLLNDLAQREGVDLSNVSTEECVKLASDIFSNQQAQTQLSEQEKVAAAKFEEASFLGKVVAHSMWNELNSIQKVAAAPADVITGTFNEAPDSIKDQIKSGIKEKMDATTRRAINRDIAIDKMKDFAKSRTGKAIAGTAAGLSLLGGGVYGTKKLMDKKKEGSAIDTLSDARAYEILQHYGLADDQGNVVPPENLYEKTASNQLADVVEQQAWEKLAQLGYPVK